MPSNSVIIVSTGRLVTLGKIGSSLEEDITWSTITYIEWVQCEGPVSVISVCLPTIFSLGKHIHASGFRSVIGGKRWKFSKDKTPGSGGYYSSESERSNNFVRMETYGDGGREGGSRRAGDGGLERGLGRGGRGLPHIGPPERLPYNAQYGGFDPRDSFAPPHYQAGRNDLFG